MYAGGCWSKICGMTGDRKGNTVQRRFIRIVAIFGLLAGLLSALSPQSAIAAGVVGDGTPGSCDEAALDAALAGGGLITFDCGNQLFVNLTTAKTISVDTQIQGPLNIILTMGNNDRHFIVNPGVTLTLE